MIRKFDLGRGLTKRFPGRPSPDAATARRRADQFFARGENAAAVACLLACAGDLDGAERFRLGACYENGTGILRNYVEAVRWYESAAQHGVPAAMDRLGDIYLSGRDIRFASHLRPDGLSVARDPERAFDWNRKAAEAGAVEAQARLAYQYAVGLGVGRDIREAEKWFLAAAEQGSVAGQFGMGVVCARTARSESEQARAVFWLEKAVAGDNANAKLVLALRLIHGEGVAADPARAITLLASAAEAGHTEAMFQLGQLRISGNGAVEDRRTGEIWLRRAGSRGHAGALRTLAGMLVANTETADYHSAKLLLRQAADLGDAGSQYALAKLLGRGVPADRAEMGVWLERAAGQGFPDAIAALQAIGTG